MPAVWQGHSYLSFQWQGPRSIFRGEGDTGRLAGNESWELGGRLTPQERLGVSEGGVQNEKPESKGEEEGRKRTDVDTNGQGHGGRARSPRGLLGKERLSSAPH